MGSMPKLIDHERRATDITEAAWRVLVRDGAKAVSVRNVAAEAGLATASLRRAFPTQDALLAGCLELLGERARRRIGALPHKRGTQAWALAALAETMPLDDARRVEMEVYLTLGTAALTDPVLRTAHARIDGGLKGLCTAVVDSLLPTTRRRQRAREVRHLHALLDGLALHVLLGMDAREALGVLKAHLESLRRV